jgi:ATP-dependent protease HslVU (ClpYQ) peptidase subunit
MSVIVVLRTSDGRSTWVGSDTLVCGGNLKQDYGPKWIVHAPWAIGVAGHLRTVNLIERNVEALTGNLKDAYEFALRARDVMKSDGYQSDTEERGPAGFGGTLILTNATGAWVIGSDFSITAVSPGTAWAEGSGREIALGAIHALQSLEAPHAPDDILRRAIDAAMALDINCGGHPWIHEVA